MPHECVLVIELARVGVHVKRFHPQHPELVSRLVAQNVVVQLVGFDPLLSAGYRYRACVHGIASIVGPFAVVHHEVLEKMNHVKALAKGLLPSGQITDGPQVVVKTERVQVQHFLGLG